MIALTANARYEVGGVRVGSALTATEPLNLQPGLRIGANTWYVSITRRETYVLKVQGGRVRELGIAAHALSDTRAGARRLIDSFRQSPAVDHVA